MPKIKVLLIEDSLLLREGTTAILNEQEDIIAESAAGNRSAFAKARKMRPDVILLDIGLKSPSTMTALASLKKNLPKMEVIVMDLLPAHSEVIELINAGVTGFVLKDSTVDEFLKTLRSAARGIGTLPPTMTDSLFSRIVESAIQQGNVDRVIKAVRLTKREQQVVGLLAAGLSTAEAAVRLKLAVYTIKAHMRSVMDKLALHTRLELAVRADRNASS